MLFEIKIYMYRKIISQLISLLFLLLINFASKANSIQTYDFPSICRTHPFYIGLSLGYGSTDWSQLVAKGTPMEIPLLAVSTPISAGDRGFLYGFVAGYELQPHFAIELNYTRFPNTTVVFDPDFYTIKPIVSMRSFTYAYNLVGKFMAQLGESGFRGFANAGASFTHRNDLLVKGAHICPTFGVGINYVFIKRIMLEMGFQYYAGYGKAVINPGVNYVPFLYALTLKLAYRF
ncbi:outer membrane beta-barrel protein [Coxiella burnetii]